MRPQARGLNAATRAEPTPEIKIAPALPKGAPVNSDSSPSEREEMFTPENPRRTLDEVILPAEVRARIEAVIHRVKNHKKLYEEWGLEEIDPYGKKVALNFFGPPGTGKSLCAEAIANYMGKMLIRVNYAEIESKYVGDTPKNITAAFRKAHATDSVLFFDEADSILGRRLTSVTQSADHGVNVSRSVMLTQLDQFDGIVLFATNLAKNYDEAFVRRIMAHVEIKLPDFECRKRIWKKHFPARLPVAECFDIEVLAKKSEGLSGGDIKNIVINAASHAVLREGALQKVLLDDLLKEIDHAYQAKEHVGASEKPIRKTEEEIPIEEAPPEVQEKCKKASEEMLKREAS